MALGKSAAVVIGSFPLGESDRVVTFFSRQHGKVRGVARAARRIKSKFGGALELLTLGELIFFDTGRSDLVRVDHFDVLRPFDRVREDLERLGQAAWMAECVGRLTAERDPNVAVYGLLLRGLKSLEAGVPPQRVAVVFGVRLVDALGHRLRVDACVGCGRRDAFGGAPLTMDVEAGGLVCAACASAVPGLLRLQSGSVAALRRLRGQAWDEAVGTQLGGAEGELRQLLDRQVALLIGQPTRTSRFVREMERFSGERG
ncbi:MAG: DNA repair protein RecO [Candidatus Rokubacteria bacterium 13_1_40CM_68_15]|nr:MAG: DNA repair protein RecO [Candidatus Rokubacteria bacterium 13_1_40CM_68_15]